jgi:hypothetical protein
VVARPAVRNALVIHLAATIIAGFIAGVLLTLIALSATGNL